MTDHPHEFETFEGASGFACTAMVMRDDAGTDCGLPAADPIHGYWKPITTEDCPLDHPYGADRWRPLDDDNHEHWVSPSPLPQGFLNHFGIKGEFVVDHAISEAHKPRTPLPVDTWAFGDHSAAYLIAATSWPWEREENRLNWCDNLVTDEALRRQEYNRAKENLERAFAYLEAEMPASPKERG